MTSREEFEKETGKTCNPHDALFYWIDYAKWLEKRNEWVSVDERLPEKDGYYLFLRDRGNLPLMSMYYTKDNGKTFIDHCWFHFNYWKALPTQPYEAKRGRG